MKPTKIILIVSTLLIAACSTSKKSTTTAPVSTATPLPPTDGYLFTKPVSRTYTPGNEELIAIQKQYKEVTLDKLKEGHTIYTEGACINCHGAKDIYEYDRAQWETIIEDMAQRANISEAQKDAVFKYILAMKTTQQK